ncbi:unnamed protein product [Darwinula stevensoni]|uniref:Thymidylate kinase n=1 Tax=Darwinula stevensoni TaxID=69355 RepID=A0A7R8ZZJ1_9CRUS|nr:unnamed protein product [Darwinula stevensoni]CAG0882595.1 unnamed protein product [Darwinula stevensoni]
MDLATGLEDLLTCPICYEAFDHENHAPKALHCSHSVCLLCLLNMERESALQVECPMCRVVSTKSSESYNFSDNYALITLMDLKQKGLSFNSIGKSQQRLPLETGSSGTQDQAGSLLNQIPGIISRIKEGTAKLLDQELAILVQPSTSCSGGAAEAGDSTGQENSGDNIGMSSPTRDTSAPSASSKSHGSSSASSQSLPKLTDVHKDLQAICLPVNLRNLREEELNRCFHNFHQECLLKMMPQNSNVPQQGRKRKGSPITSINNAPSGIRCPVCKFVYGEFRGMQPPGGTMNVQHTSRPLPGYGRCGSIIITYHIPPGIQGPEHPNPGMPYSAHNFPRFAYLPDNEEGREFANMLAKRGALIVIEGLDQVGKTSQATNLVEKLKQLGHPAQFMGFPERSTPVGKMIGEYLTRSKDLSDEAIHLLFTANRWELVPVIKQHLRDGTNLVVDRYSFSGMAYSVSKKGLNMSWCKGPEVGLPRPDLVLFLDIHPSRLTEREAFGQERYEDLKFQEAVRENFKALTEDYWQVVNADRPFSEVGQDLLEAAIRTIESVPGKPVLRLWADGDLSLS